LKRVCIHNTLISNVIYISGFHCHSLGFYNSVHVYGSRDEHLNACNELQERVVNIYHSNWYKNQ